MDIYFIYQPSPSTFCTVNKCLGENDIFFIIYMVVMLSQYILMSQLTQDICFKYVHFIKCLKRWKIYILNFVWIFVCF